MNRKGEGGCHPGDSRRAARLGDRKCASGRGGNPFPLGDKGRESEVVQAGEGSGGGVLPTPGDKERLGRGAGPGGEGFAPRAPAGGLRGERSPGWRM